MRDSLTHPCYLGYKGAVGYICLLASYLPRFQVGHKEPGYETNILVQTCNQPTLLVGQRSGNTCTSKFTSNVNQVIQSTIQILVIRYSRHCTCLGATAHTNRLCPGSFWTWSYLITGLDCGLDCWTGLMDWISGLNLLILHDLHPIKYHKFDYSKHTSSHCMLGNIHECTMHKLHYSCAS